MQPDHSGELRVWSSVLWRDEIGFDRAETRGAWECDLPLVDLLSRSIDPAIGIAAGLGAMNVVEQSWVCRRRAAGHHAEAQPVATDRLTSAEGKDWQACRRLSPNIHSTALRMSTTFFSQSAAEATVIHAPAVFGSSPVSLTCAFHLP
jgi:hypothetical protein